MQIENKIRFLLLVPSIYSSGRVAPDLSRKPASASRYDLVVSLLDVLRIQNPPLAGSGEPGAPAAARRPPSFRVIEPWPGTLLLERRNLLPQGQVFNYEISPTTTHRPDRTGAERDEEDGASAINCW